jgi:UDP-glucose 4-epimerase
VKIVLTGGTGFIGSYVAKELSDAGHSVVILARSPDKVPALARLANVRIEAAPMEDLASIERHIDNPDALVHVALCWGDTGPDMIRNETLASVSLIELAIRKGAKQVLFTSSTAASGYSLNRTDEDSRLRPEDFYGASKAAVEMFVHAYARKHPEIRFNVIRPGYAFGNPVVDGASIESDRRLREICANAKARRPIALARNDGTQFIWAGDLARLYRAVIESDVSDEVFYGLSAKFVRWDEIATWAKEITGSQSAIQLTDRGYADDPSLFVVDKIARLFGLSFAPRERLKEHVRYLLSLS